MGNICGDFGGKSGLWEFDMHGAPLTLLGT